MKDITAMIFIATKKGKIKSSADFYNNYFSNGSEQGCYELIGNYVSQDEIEEIQNSDFDDYGIISVFDSVFPFFNESIKNSEKPYLLFYRGNIELLGEVKKNVAVIGVLDPTYEIIEREKSFVKQLVEGGLNIVSGLAKGCDTIAHDSCIDYGGRTIAILPSTLFRISPAENKELATKIVESGGLLVTEYFYEPRSRFDATKRLIDRDRLQALFSSTK